MDTWPQTHITHTHHSHTSLTLHSHTHTHITHSAGCFCVADAALGARPRGRMYALASLRCPLVSAALPVAFAWQVRHLVLCHGVRCTPWRPSGVPWSPPLCRWLLRGRCGTLLIHITCPNLTRLVDLAGQKKTYGSSEAHGGVSTQLIQIDCL